MKQPIDLRPDHAKIVHEIIVRYLPAGVSVRVFGSRAKWTAKPHSDLDLALKGTEPLPRSVLGDLAEAFSESDLPFRVDVVDWHTVAPSFPAVIDRDGLTLPWPLFPLKQFVDPDRSICYGIVQPGKPVANGVPILRVNNFGINGLDTSDALRIAPEIEAQYARSRLQGGELLITLVGSVGQSAIARPELRGWNVARAVGVVPISDDLTARWVKFVFGSNKAQEFFFQRANTTVQTTVNLRDLAELPVPTPPRARMMDIVSVLSVLDDKIELKRRMNETLEGMAQAIFRDWFVDFGPVRRKAAGETDAVAILGGLTPDPARAAQLAALFPDGFGDDGLPVGWNRLHLSDIASQGKGSVNPQGQPETLFELYSLPAFDKGQEPSMDAGSTIKSNKTPVPSGAVLLSKLNPETLRVWLPNDHAGAAQIASTEFLVFIPKPDVSRSLLFALFRDPDFRTLMQGMVTGTSKSHQRISPPALLAQEVIAADVGLFPAFSALVEPMLEQLLESRAENKHLAETRDYLLPRLMSGTVRVARESAAA
jgi:type I restriction enzyme, S subunit